MNLYYLDSTNKNNYVQQYRSLLMGKNIFALRAELAKMKKIMDKEAIKYKKM